MAFIAANIASRDIAAVSRSPLPAILLSAGRFAIPRYEHASIAVAGIRHHVNGEVWHNQQTRSRQRRLVVLPRRFTDGAAGRFYGSVELYDPHSVQRIARSWT